MEAVQNLALPVLAFFITGFIIYVARAWLRKEGGRALSATALAEEDDPHRK
jgi:hypothetical protein